MASKRSGSSGPDWTDVEIAMRAVGEIHGGSISLTILPAGIGSSGGLRVALAYSSAIALLNGEEDLILSESRWPCPQGCTLAGHVFAGIYSLDHQIGIILDKEKPTTA